MEGQFEQIKLTGKKGFILLPTSLDYGTDYAAKVRMRNFDLTLEAGKLRKFYISVYWE